MLLPSVPIPIVFVLVDIPRFLVDVVCSIVIQIRVPAQDRIEAFDSALEDVLNGGVPSRVIIGGRGRIARGGATAEGGGIGETMRVKRSFGRSEPG